MSRAGFMLVVSACAAVIAFAGVAWSASPATTPAAGAGVFDIDSLLSVYPLAADQDVRSDLIAADSTSSVHLTQARGVVKRHRHLTHDENVWIIRGAGLLTLDGEERRVKAGQIVRIPRNTAHAVHNLGSTPAVVISVFVPGFDGKDRVSDAPDVRQSEPVK